MGRIDKRYPHLGQARPAKDFESALVAVRHRWPGAFAEGSTGAERTFYVMHAGDSALVGHCWPVSDGTLKVRIWQGDVAEATRLDPGRIAGP